MVTDNVTYGNGDHGIDDLNVTGGRITGNTVFYNCTTGINVEGTSGNYVIENNVAVNNATGATINPTPIDPPGAYSNACNRRDGNIGVWDSAPATSTANYNLVWQTGTGVEYRWAGTAYATQAALFAATGQEAAGIFADPKFANPTAGNFQLTAGSPAIDSADSAATGEQTTDLAGHPRVDDPATPNTGAGPRAYDDRGAYEYQPPVTGPTARLTVTPTSGTAPLGVTADASASTAGSAAITGYTFAFGDGATVGPQARRDGQSHLHHRWVVHGDGDGDRRQRADRHRQSGGDGHAPVTGPTARLTVTPASGTAPLGVTADASASTAGSAAITGYTFAFGDGTTVGPQAGATASHTYTTAGSFTVTVTVTDGNGLTATASQVVTVTSPVTGPTARLTVTPTSGTAPLGVTADASASTAGSAAITGYTFAFGDGTTVGPQAGATASHTYTTAGSFTVTVTVTDGNGLTATASQVVTVTAPVTGPTARMTVSCAQLT